MFVTVVDTGANPPSRPFSVWGLVPMSPGNRSLVRGVQGIQVAPGRYRVDGLPIDTVTLSVGCGMIDKRAWMRGGGRKSALHLTVREGLVIDTAVVVDHHGCDPRPIRSETRVFSGFWTPGFESSEFVPCTGDDWTLPSDSLSATSLEFRAWADPDSAGQRSMKRVHWPADAPRDAWGNPTYFVRWHGTMVGPAEYGHMGVSPFHLTVDSIVSVGKPTSGSCRR